jgi:excisionase family DNA binding protein
MNEDTGKIALAPNSAAHALDISRSKMYGMMKSGKIRFVMIDGMRRVPNSEVERLAREGTEPQQAAE